MKQSSVVEKFLRYVSFDTTSKENVEQFPSTSNQLVLLKQLKTELEEMGIKTQMQEYGYVIGTIPSNLPTDQETATLCFVAHVDTAPVITGKNVKPSIVKFSGEDIALSKTVSLKVENNSQLNSYLGQDIIVTDGSTLLGADDKAGVAEIMAMAEYVMANKDFLHGEIKIAFTPDEEVGRGVDFFDVASFGADFGYTIDGGEIGEIEFENFNACSVNIDIEGVSIHPGYAKGIMINAIDVYAKLHSMLGEANRPNNTTGYEGFIMANSVSGAEEQLTASYIVRDHDKKKFNDKKKFFQDTVDYINSTYDKQVLTLTIKDSYFNMKEIIENGNMHLIDNAVKAMQSCGVEPKIMPIRGGTDGCRLSYMGLPCPNLSTGGLNFHSRTEYLPVSSLENMTNVLLELVKLYCKFNKRGNK